MKVKAAFKVGDKVKFPGGTGNSRITYKGQLYDGEILSVITSLN